jgi:hypothetical protein
MDKMTMMNRQYLHTYLNKNLYKNGIFVGGHYAWPSLPDDHAVRSINMISDLEKIYDNSNSYTFIDDIGAAIMCISKCGRNKQLETIQSKEDTTIKKWINDNIKSLENEVIHNNDEHILMLFKDLMKLLPTQIITEKFDTLELIHNFEKIIYAYDKQSMKHLALSYITKRKLPQLILEKSINNLTSKQLHKLKKQKNKNLNITTCNNTYQYHAHSDFIEENTLLREETFNDENTKMIKAANRCSGLLSTFFDKLIRNNIKDEKDISIFYVIPDDDRDRLKKGINSFFALYKDIYKEKYNLENITIITYQFLEKPLIDCYKYNLVDDKYTYDTQRFESA